MNRSRERAVCVGVRTHACVAAIAISLAPVPLAAEQAGPNSHLYVTNQSFAIPVVDIEIKIDGKVVASEDFAVGLQHTWKEIPLALSDGKHSIAVRSKKGKAKLKKKFVVKGSHWALLSFWYYPKTHYEPTPRHFIFRIQDEPVIFM